MNWLGFCCARDVKEPGETPDGKLQQTSLRD
jgi:hypothetical protein